MAAEAVEHEAEQVEFEDEPEAGQAGPEGPPVGAVLAGIFQSVGNVVCTRAGVSKITDQEAATIGHAAADVAALYDFEVSPEVAAWLGLGMAAVGVLGPRLDEYAATIEPGPVVDPGAVHGNA